MAAAPPERGRSRAGLLGENGERAFRLAVNRPAGLGWPISTAGYERFAQKGSGRLTAAEKRTSARAFVAQLPWNERFSPGAKRANPGWDNRLVVV
jgi:hypothetical protein